MLLHFADRRVLDFPTAPRHDLGTCRVAAMAVSDPAVVAWNIMATSAGSRAIAAGLDVASMLEEARACSCACSTEVSCRGRKCPFRSKRSRLTL